MMARSILLSVCLLFLITGSRSQMSDGSGSVTAKLPDSVTAWETDMFCISEEDGFGMTPESLSTEARLEVFLSLLPPSYANRDETVVVGTTIANYFNHCIETLTIMTSSSEFEIVESPIQDVPECFCEGAQISMVWTLSFKSLGNVNMTVSMETVKISDTCGRPNIASLPSFKDTVTRSIFIECEGIPTEITISNLISVNDESSEIEMSIPAPDSLVPDCSNIQFTLVGDAIGLSAQNLDNMLLLPAGCCQQILGTMLPVALLIKHFKNQNQLSDELLEKAKNKLSQDYGRLLACRNWDGNFYLFPGSTYRNPRFDVETLYALSIAREHIYVDENILVLIVTHLGELQDLSTGCLAPAGVLSNQDTEDYVYGYTCYAAVRMMKTDLPSNGGSVLNRALQCLDNANFDVLSTTTQSCLFYAACLAEQWDKAKTMFTKFEGDVVTEGGTAYWVERDSQGLPVSYNSNAMEITTNILSGLLKHPGLKEFVTTLGGKALAWTSNQMNLRGGFSNAMDTMYAIEVLTEYSNFIGSAEITDVHVTVSKDGEVVASLSVTEQNKLLVQTQQLSSYGTYNIVISGTGTPLLQISSQHNIQIAKEDSPISVQVEITGICSDGIARSLDSKICVRYNGIRPKTNVVFIKYKSFSGYSPDEYALYKLQQDNVVAKAERVQNHVHIYIMSLAQDEEFCFSFPSYVGERVLTYQNSNCVAVDIDEATESGAAIFSHPCTAKV